MSHSGQPPAQPQSLPARGTLTPSASSPATPSLSVGAPVTTGPAAPPSVTLRQATVDDRQAMLGVMAPFTNAYFPGQLVPSTTRVAEINGEIVGFVGWKDNQVLALYVVADWRRKRTVGKILLKSAEAAIQARGYKRVRILIDAEAKEAHRFYVKQDYETDWDRENEDIAWMIKTF